MLNGVLLVVGADRGGCETGVGLGEWRTSFIVADLTEGERNVTRYGSDAHRELRTGLIR